MNISIAVIHLITFNKLYNNSLILSNTEGDFAMSPLTNLVAGDGIHQNRDVRKIGKFLWIIKNDFG